MPFMGSLGTRGRLERMAESATSAAASAASTAAMSRSASTAVPSSAAAAASASALLRDDASGSTGLYRAVSAPGTASAAGAAAGPSANGASVAVQVPVSMGRNRMLAGGLGGLSLGGVGVGVMMIDGPSSAAALAGVGGPAGAAGYGPAPSPSAGAAGGAAGAGSAAGASGTAGAGAGAEPLHLSEYALQTRAVMRCATRLLTRVHRHRVYEEDKMLNQQQQAQMQQQAARQQQRQLQQAKINTGTARGTARSVSDSDDDGPDADADHEEPLSASTAAAPAGGDHKDHTKRDGGNGIGDAACRCDGDGAGSDADSGAGAGAGIGESSLVSIDELTGLPVQLTGSLRRRQSSVATQASALSAAAGLESVEPDSFHMEGAGSVVEERGNTSRFASRGSTAVSGTAAVRRFATPSEPEYGSVTGSRMATQGSRTITADSRRAATGGNDAGGGGGGAGGDRVATASVAGAGAEVSGIAEGEPSAADGNSGAASASVSAPTSLSGARAGTGSGTGDALSGAAAGGDDSEFGGGYAGMSRGGDASMGMDMGMGMGMDMGIGMEMEVALPVRPSFSIAEFLAEETPADAEPFLKAVTATQLFNQFLSDRASPVPGGEPDAFDRGCFRRLFLRSYQQTALRSAPWSGILVKAVRGTLSRGWERRWIELHGNSLRYYKGPDKMESLWAEVQAARRALAGLRRETGGAGAATAASASTSASAMQPNAAGIKGLSESAPSGRVGANVVTRDLLLLPASDARVIAAGGSAAICAALLGGTGSKDAPATAGAGAGGAPARGRSSFASTGSSVSFARPGIAPFGTPAGPGGAAGSGLPAGVLSVPPSATELAVAAAERLRRAEAAFEAARSRNFRREFAIVPGRTEVVVPSSLSVAFATPYAFQLVNPSLDEMREIYASAAAAGGGGGSGSGSSGTSAFAASLAALNLGAAGRERDTLTLCASSSRERRQWIVHLKARLRTAEFNLSLNRLYLGSGLDGALPLAPAGSAATR